MSVVSHLNIMQPDPPDHATVPGSPPSLASFRHPQPTPTVDDGAGLRLRRRPSRSAPMPRSTLCIQLQTPYADLGVARPASGWNVLASSTVLEAKDLIADGTAGYGRWERTGLRIVWRGRILDDADVLGNILADESTPTLHLVARPIVDPVSLTASGNAVPAVEPSAIDNGAVPALADSVHYLLFSAREQLCGLVGTPALRWEDAVPPPIVGRAEARGAVMSVVQTCSRGEWPGWQGAFDQDFKGIWRALGREGVQGEVSALWLAVVGRQYGLAGDLVPVEIDHSTYNLQLPALADMVPTQLVHLLLYLRIIILIPHISAALTAAQTTERLPVPSSTTDPTVPLPPMPVRVAYRASIRLRVPNISLVLLTHQFWSGVRLVICMWMLTRNLAWNDGRLWLLAGMGLGWWVVDGYNLWAAEQRVERLRIQRERRAEGGDEADEANVAAEAAADAPLHAAAAARAAGVRLRQPRVPANQTAAASVLTLVRDRLQNVPLYHLDVDSRQLRLPVDTSPVPGPPRIGRPPATRPGWWSTQLFLPFYLWFVTLIPAFEARRARVIRQRERTMRNVMSSLTPEGGQAADDAGEVATTEPVFPDGISPPARRYYARVARRGDAIDWEEERDAQRAMGIPDEEQEAGFGLL